MSLLGVAMTEEIRRELFVVVFCLLSEFNPNLTASQVLITRSGSEGRMLLERTAPFLKPERLHATIHWTAGSTKFYSLYRAIAFTKNQSRLRDHLHTTEAIRPKPEIQNNRQRKPIPSKNCDYQDHESTKCSLLCKWMHYPKILATTNTFPSD